MTEHRRSLALGAAMLTGFSLLTKFMGMGFRLYLTARIGAEGIGLFQVIMSVFSLFATFASAGFTVAVSKLAAQRSEAGSITTGAVSVFRKAVAVSMVPALTGFAVLTFFGGPLSSSLMHDARLAPSLRILAAGLPFIAASNCLKGLFLAEGKAWKTALAPVTEQLVRIIVSCAVFFFLMPDELDAGRLCAAAASGATAGEISSFAFLFTVFAFTSKVRGGSAPSRSELISEIAPLAAGSYVTTALHSGEGLLIPLCLTLYGGDRSTALAEYGMIRGMVIPLLFFPFSFLSSLVSLLIPDLSREGMRGQDAVRHRVNRIIGPSLIFSLFVGAVFFLFPSQLAVLFYKSDECSYALRVLAAVTPAMYIETVCDGILKAIGYQRFTLFCNVLNSILRVVCIIVLLPRTGAQGYLWLLFASNLFTFAMCYFKLRSVTGFTLSESLRFYPRKKRIRPRA